MADQNNTIKTTVELDSSQARKEIVQTNEAAAASQQKLNKSLGDTKDSAKALDGITGGLGAKFSGLLAPLKSVALGFKSIGSAIALSGIGLIVLTLVALKTAFTSSEEGQNKFAKLMGVIGAVTGNLLDILADLGEFIIGVFENPKQSINDFANLIKQNITNRFEGLLELIPNLGKAVQKLFSGDFAEAGKIAADAMGKVTLGVDSVTDSINNATAATSKFIEEQKREAGLAAKVADFRADAAKKDRALLVERAKSESDIARLKLQAREEDKFSAAQRKKFLLEAQDLEDGLLSKEKESLQLKLDAQKLENTFSRTDIENKDKEAEAEAALFKIEARRFTQQKATQRELLRVNGQIAKKNKAIRDAELKEEKERQDELNRIREANTDAELSLSQIAIDAAKLRGEKVFELEVALLEKKRNLELENVELTELGKKEIEERFKLEKDELKKAESDKLAEEAAEKRDALLEEKAIDAENEAISFEERRALLKERDILIAEDQTLTEEQRTALLKENTDARISIGEEETDAKKKSVAALGSALATAGDLLGKSTVAGKAAAIASTTIDTIQSGISAFKGMIASIPGPVGIAAGSVAAAGVVASGIASVKKIVAVKTPKSSGGSSLAQGLSGIKPPSGNIATTDVVSDLSANNSARLGIDPSLGSSASADASNNVVGGASSNVIFSESQYSNFKDQVDFKESKSSI